MPRDIKLMRSVTLRQVAYHPKLSLSVKHPPAVNYGRGQPGISVVTALKQIKLLACNPLLDAGLGGKLFQENGPAASA